MGRLICGALGFNEDDLNELKLSWRGNGTFTPAPIPEEALGLCCDDSYAPCLLCSQPGRGNRPGKNPKYSGHSTGVAMA